MRMIHVLGVSLAGAAALAIAGAGTSGARGDGPSRGVPLAPEPVEALDPELPPGHPPVGATAAEPVAEEAAAGIEGVVKEVLQVDKYTYLRLDREGEVVWVAVPRQEVAVGRRVRVADATEMADFSSPSLGRTFDRIWFGVLDAAASPSASPHGAAAGAALAPKAGSIPRAGGPTGRSVAETLAQAAKLSGATVRVRGKVTKRTEGVLGKTWLHVTDGGERDLVVTTTDPIELGAVVLLEGRVATDRDLGSGYRYDVLLEDARVVETSP